MRTVVFTHKAARDLDGLPADIQIAITEALSIYAVSGAGDVKRLRNRDGYRLRVGRYRVIFAEDEATILAVYVGKRETTTYTRN